MRENRLSTGTTWGTLQQAYVTGEGDTGYERPRGMSKVTDQVHWHWKPQQLPS